MLALGLVRFSEEYGRSEVGEDRAAEYFAECVQKRGQPQRDALPPAQAKAVAALDAALADLLPMRTQSELDCFATESELGTGPLDRAFVVAGADGPAFRVRFDEACYLIQRVGCEDEPAAHTRATATGLADHALGDAMASGRRFPTRPCACPWPHNPFQESCP